jgi:hypothetical protein
MRTDATIETLNTAIVNLMTERGFGDQWRTEVEPLEAIDFDYCYPVLEIPRVTEFNIFLKQRPLRVKETDSWMNISHSFNWQEGKQYWFEIIHDLSGDPDRQFSQEIRMVDTLDLVDRMVIPVNAEIRDIVQLWRRILDVPDGLEIQCARHNDLECHWGIKEGSAIPLIECTVASESNQGNVTIHAGSDEFKADQISRLLVIKTPPFWQARVENEPNHVTLRFEGEWILLALRILHDHDFAFQLGGRLIEARTITSWWYPYDFEAIMKYGNSLDSAIPPDPNGAEFPPEQWTHRVVIRIKTMPAANMPLDPLPAGDPSLASGLPKTWADVDPGNPRPISVASSGLVGYHTSDDVKPADDGTPTDESLLAWRGWAKKDEEVHRLIGWPTLKDYPTHVGISLEVPDCVGSETHEIQFWEVATFLPPINLAAELHISFVDTLRNRSQKRSKRLKYDYKYGEHDYRYAKHGRDRVWLGLCESWNGRHIHYHDVEE